MPDSLTLSHQTVRLNNKTILETTIPHQVSHRCIIAISITNHKATIDTLTTTHKIRPLSTKTKLKISINQHRLKIKIQMRHNSPAMTDTTRRIRSMPQMHIQAHHRHKPNHKGSIKSIQPPTIYQTRMAYTKSKTQRKIKMATLV